MATDQEKIELEARAKRLRWAREQAGFKGPTSAAIELTMSVNTYKAYEQGRNGFGLSYARKFARLFKVSLPWLNFGAGSPDDKDIPDEAERLRDAFVKAKDLPPLSKERIIGYVDSEIERYEKSPDTATNPDR